MESAGPASKLRAVAELKPEANRSAKSARNRACSLKAKEILAQRAPRQGVCGRHGEKEKRLTWGDFVVFPVRVFMAQGRRAGGISEALMKELST